MLIVGVWVGGHASWLPSPLRSGVVADSQARLVHQVLDDIQGDYFRKVNRTQLVNSGLVAMIASLHDPFSHYFSPTVYKSLFGVSHVNGIGVDVDPVSRGLEIVDVFTGYPAARAGLAPGDVIIAVGSTSLVGRSGTFAQGLIRGRPGTKVVLTYLAGGRRHVVRITRAHVVVPIDADRMIDYHGMKLGYVELTTFDEPGAGDDVRTDVEQLLHRGARGIVLDLRGNGGGLISEAVKTASIFIPAGTIATIRGRNTPRQVFTATGNAISTKIGTHTFGKGVFQDSFGLPGGGVLEIVAGYYYTPNGRNLGGGGVKQGAGVKPNVYAAENLRGPTDHQLNVALKTLAAEVR